MMLIAMDKASVRTVNGFGQMFVEISNLSKAGVNPYRGSEIPRHAELGLDPDKVYRLLRCPAELAKPETVESFNGLPLLDRHVPVTADKPSQDRIVGSTGTAAMFDEPFLRNSLSVWTAGAIAGIQTKQLRELSCAYSYEADMTPGVFEGVAYDGIMRNIRGNHVALVEVGRAGPECVVGDSKLLEKTKMSGKKLTANAGLVMGAIAAILQPVLAQDAQIGDLTAIAAGVKGPLSAKDKQTIVAKVTKAYGDKLAQDANLDGLPAVLDALVLGEDEAPALKADDSPDLSSDAAFKKALVERGMAEDEADAFIAKKTPPKKDDTVEKPAMDAAIKLAVDSATSNTMVLMKAMRAAENKVRPIIGELAIAQDSAAAVFKLALDSAGIKTEGINEAAFEPMVDMLLTTRANATPAARVTIAQDSAASAATGLSARFPNALKLKGGV